MLEKKLGQTLHYRCSDRCDPLRTLGLEPNCVHGELCGSLCFWIVFHLNGDRSWLCKTLRTGERILWAMHWSFNQNATNWIRQYSRCQSAAFPTGSVVNKITDRLENKLDELTTFSGLWLIYLFIYFCLSWVYSGSKQFFSLHRCSTHLLILSKQDARHADTFKSYNSKM